MTTKKTVATTKNDVEVIDPAATAREPELKDGVYTEYDVELVNGVRIPVSVIVDNDLLPATYSLHLENPVAALLGRMTPSTRYILDRAGATQKDIYGALMDVVARGLEAADKDAE